MSGSLLWEFGEGPNYWAWTKQNYPFTNAKNWNTSYKLRPGELVMFHDKNIEPSNNRGTKNVSIPLDIETKERSINTGSGETSQGTSYGQITNSSSFLIGPRTKATFYNDENYTEKAFGYPYRGHLQPDIDKSGGILNMKNLPWTNGDGPWNLENGYGYNQEDKINSLKIEWVDYDSLKLDCCKSDSSRGVDPTLCGIYWGKTHTGACDDIYKSHCGNEAMKLKDVETEADIPADYDTNCYCFNWASMPEFKTLGENDFVVAGVDTIQPACHLNKCRDFGYKSRGMLTSACTPITLCQQIMGTEAGNNINMNEVGMTQYCGAEDDGQTVDEIVANQPTDAPYVKPASPASPTSPASPSEEEEEKGFWDKYFGSDNKNDTSKSSSNTILWIILGIIAFLIVIVLFVKLLKSKKRSPPPPRYPPYPYGFGRRRH